MVLRYYNIPGINPAGDFQCGLAAAAIGGICRLGCKLCNVGGGSIQNIALFLNSYASYIRISQGVTSPSISSRVLFSSLSPTELAFEIQNGRPVIAGISLHLQGLPPGLSEHAVVIVGFEVKDDQMNLVLNDPYPYNASGVQNPYTESGGEITDITGRYKIPYKRMVADLNWSNSIFDISI
jgi:hypothetical protein